MNKSTFTFLHIKYTDKVTSTYEFEILWNEMEINIQKLSKQNIEPIHCKA